MMFRHSLYTETMLFLVALVALSGCGDDAASTISAHLKISGMQSPSRQSKARARGAISSNLMPSKTHFAYSAVDGVRFHLTRVLGEAATSDNNLTEIDMVKDVELTGEGSQSIALNEAVNWAPGNYRGISLHFTNKWEVKSHCWTMKSGGSNTGYLVYTTASGVAVKDCTSEDCTVLPDSYDYYAYNTLNTYSGYADSNDYQQETHLNFEVKSTDTPVISMLYDGSYGVTCWDGQVAYDTSAAFGGFSGMEAGTHATYFGATTPVFTTYYLPIFGYLTNDANEATPTARTFLASSAYPADGADLDTTQVGFTFKPLTVMTLVYKADGTILAGSTRNYQGNGATNPFDLDLEGFSSAAGGGTDFYGSGWYYQGGSEAPQFIRNKQIQAFSPAGSLGTLFSSTYVDGPGCGQSLTDFQNNNPSRGCMGSPSTVWFKEVNR